MAHFGPSTTPARPDFARSGQPPVPQAWTKPERVNRYAAKCVNCQVWVPAGEGRLTNTGANGTSGAWVVSHIPPCPEVKTVPEVVPNVEPKTLGAPVAPANFKVPEGRYTVVFEDGEYKTIRVTRQNKDADFMPDRVLLAYLSGSDNDHDYTRFAHVDESGSVRIWKKHQSVKSLSEAVKVLLGDPKAASKAYAAESGCCGVCGRTLTTPESLEAGIGPVCAERTGF